MLLLVLFLNVLFSFRTNFDCYFETVHCDYIKDLCLHELEACETIYEWGPSVCCYWNGVHCHRYAGAVSNQPYSNYWTNEAINYDELEVIEFIDY